MYQLTNNSFTQRLSHEVGWGYKDVVDRLEEKRKIKAQAFHERKVRTSSHTVTYFILTIFSSSLQPSCAKRPLLILLAHSRSLHSSAIRRVPCSLLPSFYSLWHIIMTFYMYLSLSLMHVRSVAGIEYDFPRLLPEMSRKTSDHKYIKHEVIFIYYRMKLLIVMIFCLSLSDGCD